MDSPEDVRRTLAIVAQSGIGIAVVFHLAVALALGALATGRWRPTRLTSLLALGVPLISVCGAAWRTANALDAWVFALLSVVVVWVAALLADGEARRGPPWAVGLGLASIAFAWVYPHDLEGHSPWLYLVAAPMGLVPAPTLALVAGFGVIGGAFGSRAWALGIGCASVLYGLVGLLWLRVPLDAFLLVPGVALFALATRIHKPTEREEVVPTGLPRSILRGEPTLPA